ncbi:hypothetical protein CPB84DRAFT_1803193 [Gymnopilus junonius]|uniref:HNH nuclease domain-containing protein n=1 Tax=Gymnopilus junonius TaxID=109634 RepID=A0A9P5N6T3_GYMJU|nr:hypothetical protein CPB84DRAFT_1803193 [Gymnopilus junonius]
MRDEIDGKQCCIVCGTTLSLRHAHILPPEDVAGHFIWLKLKETQEIPQWVQGVEEEPRNGLSLCATHHVAFDNYQFYIRYVPSPLDRFILINISTHPDLSQFHGKAIFLNPAHRIVPFPQLLYIHEYSARAQYASLDSPAISNTVVYPNWLRFSGGAFARVVR